MCFTSSLFKFKSGFYINTYNLPFTGVNLVAIVCTIYKTNNQ